MPNFLISIAPSARKKNFLGPHVVGQDLKSYVSESMALQRPLDSVERGDVTARYCLSALAISEPPVLAAVPQP